MSNVPGLENDLQLVSTDAGQSAQLMDAIAEPPALALTIDGASTLTFRVADHERILTRSAMLDTRSWAVALGYHFELVGISKSGDYLTITMEDAIAAELRRHTKPMSFPAGSTTRRHIGVKLCHEARVPYAIDPTHKGKIHNALHRGADGQKTDSWDFLGSDVASPIGWRRFSDGRQFVMGGDAWLTSSYKAPVTIRENTGGVGSIDFDLDVAKRASTAKVTIDTRVTDPLGFGPGAPVQIADLGPATENLWLVSEANRKLTSSRGDLTLVRKTHVLKEPKHQGGAKSSKDKDSGDPGFVPGQTGADTGGTAATAARERMVNYALAQRGKPYVWGKSGPGSFDCSGLVQAATAAAGHTLGKPAASQWAACVRAGKTIPVSQALGIRGALLFRIGGGEYNHVVINLGDHVNTVQAKGHAYGCGVFADAATGGWTGAALWA